MKVLITGATGLIGSRIVELCHEGGIDVHYLTTSKEKLENKANYKGFYWNPDNDEIDEKAFVGVSSIINLVGATISKRWTTNYKKVILESRTHTANLLYKNLQKIDHNITHFISASGISLYPNSKTKLYTEESDEVDNNFLAEVVVAWEVAADQFKNLGMDTAKVRTGVVLSNEDGAFPQIVKPIKLGLGAAIGSGQQWLSWIHIDDIAGIYYFILKNQLEGVYNAVAPNPVTNQKLNKQIAEKLEVPFWMPNIPTFLMKMILGEMAVLVTEGQLVSARKIEQQGYTFQYYNLDAALDNLLKTK